MRRLLALLTLGVLSAGCASLEWPGHEPLPQVEADDLVARAGDLERSGASSAARDLYAQVVREPVRDAAHARALYRLALLYTGPSVEVRDYRAAHGALERLLAEYPAGEWESDARGRRAALAALLAREADVARLEGEVARLRSDLARSETELVRRRDDGRRLRDEGRRLHEEVARLKADLQRLKQIDLDLYRRR